MAMAKLTGWCACELCAPTLRDIEGIDDSQTNPCPCCGGVDTCDVSWLSEPPFSENEMVAMLEQYGGPESCNIFPGGVPGKFNPILVIYVDKVGFERKKFDAYMRDRVLKHLNGGFREKTDAVVLVSRTKSSMQSKLECKTFQKMVDEWRWIDETFAPYVSLRTNSSLQGFEWKKNYDSKLF